MRVQINVFKRKMIEEAGVQADKAIQNQCEAKLRQRRAARHAIEDGTFLKQRNEDCLK
jgi:hypothetical protein